MTEDGHISPGKLSIVIQSGEFARVHYALVLAAAAAAIDKPVTLFFTMEGSRALLRDGAGGAPGWVALGGDAAIRDRAFADSGVATFEDLLGACAELGVRFLVCEMGLKAEAIDRESLRDDVPIEITGAVTFLSDASKDGAMLYV